MNQRFSTRSVGVSALRPLRWLGLITLVLGVALASRARAQTAQTVRDADRGTPYFKNAAAATAATEKVVDQMLFDFSGGGFAQVDSSLTFYSTFIPQVSDNPYWTNYIFLRAFQ